MKSLKGISSCFTKLYYECGFQEVEIIDDNFIKCWRIVSEHTFLSRMNDEK
jgi:hypothetical protein